MNDLLDKTSPEAKAARKSKSFEEFMAKPETKLILSLVPAGDNPDAVRTLLLAAFDAGSQHGTGDILVDLVGAMFKDRGGSRGDERKF